MRDGAETTDSEALLSAAAQRLAMAAPVEKIILFGSRARGDHNSDSDFDLCVILDDAIPVGVYTPVSLWKAVAGIDLPIQIVAIRSGVFEIAKRDINSVSYDIDNDGLVIYETPSPPALSP